jgi:hypothetical protein
VRAIAHPIVLSILQVSELTRELIAVRSAHEAAHARHRDEASQLERSLAASARRIADLERSEMGLAQAALEATDVAEQFRNDIATLSNFLVHQQSALST